MVINRTHLNRTHLKCNTIVIAQEQRAMTRLIAPTRSTYPKSCQPDVTHQYGKKLSFLTRHILLLPPKLDRYHDLGVREKHHAVSPGTHMPPEAHHQSQSLSLLKNFKKKLRNIFEVTSIFRNFAIKQSK